MFTKTELVNKISSDYFEKAVFFDNKAGEDGSYVFAKNMDRVKDAKSIYELSVHDAKKVLSNIIEDTTNAPKTPLATKDNALGVIEKTYALSEYYRDILVNKGKSSYDPQRESLDCFEFLEEIRILDGVMKDNHAIGGLITVMTQIIQTAATEILPTEMSIHDRISRKMDIAPRVIVKFPYVQLNAPGGLFYANIQDLKATSFGSDEEVTAQMENVGIKVFLGHKEMKNFKSFDLLMMHYQVAHNALINFKNQWIVTEAMNNGVTYYDNLDADNSLFGKTDGRVLAAGFSKNDTLTFKNFFNVYEAGLEKSYDMSTVLLSPAGHKVINNTPEIRNLIVNKEAAVIFARPQGNVGRASEPNYRGQYAGTNPGEFNRFTPSIPAGLTNVQFTFIVTKSMPTFYVGDAPYKTYDIKTGNKEFYYDANNNKVTIQGKHPYTSICLLDPTEAIVYMEGEKGFMERNDDWEKHYEARFLEEYCFYCRRGGEAIGWIKNVAVVDRDTIFDPAQTVVTMQGIL